MENKDGTILLPRLIVNNKKVKKAICKMSLHNEKITNSKAALQLMLMGANQFLSDTNIKIINVNATKDDVVVISFENED